MPEDFDKPTYTDRLKDYEPAMRLLVTTAEYLQARRCAAMRVRVCASGRRRHPHPPRAPQRDYLGMASLPLVVANIRQQLDEQLLATPANKRHAVRAVPRRRPACCASARSPRARAGEFAH